MDKSRVSGHFGTINRILTSIFISVASFSLALLVGALLIQFMDLSPVEAYRNLLRGSLGSINAFGESVVTMTPLVFTGLSFAMGRRGGMVNLGAQGQLYIGALFATAAGVYLQGLPMVIHLPIAISCAFLGGGLWGLVAGFLKVKFGASEIITTIMLNHIAISFTNFMVVGPMIEPPGNWPQTARVEQSARLLQFVPGTRIHLGIILAILMAYLMYRFLWQTSIGYETRVVGYNPEAAKYAGMRAGRVAMLTMFLAGGMAGLAGATEILGVQFRLMQDFGAKTGFEGIAVALLGKNYPFGILVSAFLFGAIKAGSNTM